MAKALIAFDIFSGFRPQHSVEGGSPKKMAGFACFNSNSFSHLF